MLDANDPSDWPGFRDMLERLIDEESSRISPREAWAVRAMLNRVKELEAYREEIMERA